MGLGKWIAGALGWAMLGPIGGILGYYFTSRIEKLSEAAAEYEGTQVRNQGQRNSFLMSLLVLSAAVIKADGKTTAEEIKTLKSFFSKNFGAEAGDESMHERTCPHTSYMLKSFSSISVTIFSASIPACAPKFLVKNPRNVASS